MAYPVSAPAGYTAPASFTAYAAATTTTSSQIAAFNSLQTNVLGIGYDLTQLVPSITTLNNNVLGVNTSVTNQIPKFNNISTKLQKLYAKPTTFSNLSTQVHHLDVKVANMQPLVITQSISFLLGAFVALAFVMACKARY